MEMRNNRKRKKIRKIERKKALNRMGIKKGGVT